ncbi:hypothetical protein A2631_03570 [Candidatus Daviesbacteria bacterium RIFCSPHIGHO2_01_FULL_44_29]|uniref:Type 4 fimbrial biogenesis protein PilX N-terminal domain-containing protein n=1 Tax=Candidatus Daviesbacteria bacterium RIFCSPHIGHO2_02_FULL_43_12 TaxID=1797776 RepID=A0A1F5KFV3_9BACT|nr:MAG: hypothetical protein A2631_03570 [Candidatus Daviesbacteria bacterium RIFCSPHIGHO2_01_FULL_44_29]OGE38822.1 MAG: hypothetical protein A3E86_02815 [Candidatus Daviesbacteria bacterium RIFCSPHIGHO2_12_FULL_47_45]OGE39719.1 MAG: hypothetical protein A3D25_03255 [Candidatus Daviesbacteria bacterium RIFCSPHIGHO2_02_FULL_43_12]OGE69990.1 MAG: hypothetical protein A3B55_04835 [Candidatus Daviesbacteria bacterium RIFCSPLOWO2_01_FULL_43_15]
MNQSGQIVILALIAVAVVLVNVLIIIGGGLLVTQSSTNSISQSQAINLAEAGIDKAVATLNATAGAYTGEEEIPLGNGSYSVTITSLNPTTKSIQATGYIPSKTNPEAQKTVKIQVSKGMGAAFNYGLQIGDGGLSMSNNAVVNGSVYANSNISMSNNAQITGDAYVGGGIQPTADQTSDCSELNCGDFQFGRTAGGQLDIAQGFKPSETTVLNKILLKLKKVGTPPDLTVRILGDQNGTPNKNSVLASATLTAALTTTEYGFVDVIFSPAPSLTVDTLYWIVIDTSVNSTNYWNWSMDTLQGYTRDNPYSPRWSPNWQASSPTWSPIPGDLGFQTFMGGVTTSLIGANNVVIGGNAHANTLQDLIVTGGAYYQTASNVTAGSMHPNSPDPIAQSMSLSAANIQEWKDTATALNVYTGDITNCPAALAAGKYVGNISLPSNCMVVVDSPIYVTGNLTLDGNDVIQLNPSYGVSSGTFIVDQIITFNSGSGNKILGTSSNGSYLILISEFNSREISDHKSAVVINNNGNIGILYSNLGAIDVSNNNTFTSISAWKLNLENNVIINYDQGLASAFFSSGPSGSYTVVKGTYQLK